MSILDAIAKLGKVLFTSAKIADAGLSIYVITNQTWNLIDPGSRYPALRNLIEQYTTLGVQYDEELDDVVKKSNDLTNLSNGLNTLNNTVDIMDTKGVKIYERYDELHKQRDSFVLQFPTLRNWFNEAWIRKHNLDPDDYKQITSTDGPSILDIVATSGFIVFGVVTTGFRIKSLVAMGRDAYLRHTNARPMRPRADAIVAPTGRIARLKNRWTMFRIRNPRFFGGIKTLALGASLGLNLYLVITEAKKVADRESYFREQIKTIKENLRYLKIYKSGTKDDNDIIALMQHYKLGDNPQNHDELLRGVDGLLSDYNKNLDDCLGFIDNTFEQLQDDRDLTGDKGKDLQKEIRDEHDEYHRQVKAIQDDNNGETRKEKIVKLSNFTRDSLAKRFDDWIEVLDGILEFGKIQAMIASQVEYLVEDLRDLEEGKRPGKITREASRIMATIKAVFPNRKFFQEEKEVVSFLEHFVDVHMKQLQAA